MHYNNWFYLKIRSLLPKIIESRIIFSSLFIFFNVIWAFSPVLVLEWSNPINSLPKHLVFFDTENDRLPEIAVAINPNRVILFSNTGDSVLWSFRSPYPVSKLAVLQRGRESNPLLMVAASPYLYGINGAGKISWNLFFPGINDKAITWLATRNFGPSPGEEIMAIAGDFIFFIEAESKSMTKFKLPFLPKQVEISNLDGDDYEEVLVSNFDKLISVKAGSGIQLDLPLNNLNHEVNRGFDIYDFNSDRSSEIISITQNRTDSTQSELNSSVTCFSAIGKVLWQSSLGRMMPRAIRVFRSEIFIGGTSASGQENLIKMDRTGKIIKTIYLAKEELPRLIYSPVAKFNTNSIDLQDFYSLGNFILAEMGWSTENEVRTTYLKLFSSNLDEINLASPDYFSNLNIITSDRNQKILSLYFNSINGDTLDDLIVLREDNQEYAIDCFINRTDILSRAESEMLNSYRSALELNNPTIATRYKQRAEILGANLGNLNYALRTENSMSREWNNRFKLGFLRTILITIGLVFLIGGLGIVLVRPIIKRIVWRKAQVEAKSVPTVVKIATDLIALNHNYIVKGNRTGAYNRLKEIINKYSLNADQDLKIVSRQQFSSDTRSPVKPGQDDFLIPYNRFIKRLHQETRIVNLAAIIKKICYNILNEKSQIRELLLNRNDYKMNHLNEITQTSNSNLAVSFFYLVNVDFPDIYRHSRFFWDSRLYNWFEHVCTDHLRYAKSYAHFVFDYETATEWNRKLVIHLISDSEESIDFDRKDLHLVSEFEDIKANYQDYVVMPDKEQVLYYPGEKIWIKVFDLLSILSSIIGFK